MNRIDARFKNLKKNKQKAFITFVTAGYPSLKKTIQVVEELERSGVDIIELGVPFSDPLADGPVIQESSRLALLRGTTLRGILETVKKIRRKSQIPIVLMGYLNPFLVYGLERFARDAVKAGVDGVIIPDVPPEEGGEMSRLFARAKLSLIYLAAPTSSRARLEKIARVSRGFIYYVSMTGVTGMKRQGLDSAAWEPVKYLRKITQTPVCVGFGVSTPQDARNVASRADGVIVGSAIVKRMLERPDFSAASFSRDYIEPLARAVKGS